MSAAKRTDARRTDAGRPAATSRGTGLLVLGMHRSGTSALARVLQLGGADIGARVSGAGEGNETGHWEDAVAVQVHEQLLAALGRRWDAAAPLPADWPEGEAAAVARRAIRGYLETDRAGKALWALKDPRLSLFARLWREQAESLGQPLAAVLVLRHPMEVANSLAARDGIAQGRGLLLWLEHTLGALEEASRLPNVVVGYEQLLEDWQQVTARIRTLPGAAALAYDGKAKAAVEAFLDAGLRHHRQPEHAQMPRVVEEAWKLASGFARDGRVSGEGVARFQAVLADLRELLAPVLDEARAAERLLWERTWSAEAAVLELAKEARAASTVEQVAHEVRTSHAMQVDAFTSEFHNLRTTVDDSTQASQALTRRFELHGQQLAAIHNQVAGVRQAVDETLAPVVPTLQSALGNEMRTLTDIVLTNQQAAQDALAGQIEAVAQAATQANARAAGMEQGLAQVHARAAGMEQGLAQVHARAAGVEQGLAQVHASAAGMEQGLAQVHASAAGIEHGLAQLQARNATLEEQVAQANVQAAGLAQGLAQLAELLPRHEAVLAELGEARAALQQAREDVRSGNELLAEAAAALENEFGRAEANAAELHRVWSESEARQREVERMQVEVAQRYVDIESMGEEYRQGRLRLGEEHQREVAGLLAERARLRELAEELEQVKASRSWRITRPIRVGMRLLSGRWADSDTARLRAWQRRLIAATPFLGAETRARLIGGTLPSLEQGDTGTPTPIAQLPDAEMAPMVGLAERPVELPDVFVWAVIDWNFRFQRPQHLAQALAEKGHRVFYISVNFADNHKPGFHLVPLDTSNRLYQIHLNLPGEPLIYSAMPTPEQSAMLTDSLGELLLWTRTTSGMSIVQHPFWVEFAQAVPNVRLVYDCMDHHGGFENNCTPVLEAERKLVAGSDLLIVTSGWLKDEFESSARDIAVIRNAGEFGHFSVAPEDVFRDPQGRQVIGYYGAIAEWFDTALVRRVAEQNPGALVVLVGHDSAGARNVLGDLPNVQMVGEVPYARLPYWLHAFDVCMLPFRIIPLTLATNPVKLYEYLSAGKPVVAVDLPEMAQFGDLVEVASDSDDFVRRVRRELAAPLDLDAVRRRQAFAADQTWLHRAEELDAALERIKEPRISVVVLTYNNLVFSQACLDSIENYSDYGNLEVIVVDNASSDGSVDWLRGWEAEGSRAGHRRRLILNGENLGFAAGNNVGLAAATGELLVMLNNDTYATPGWVRTLCKHLRRDPTLGLVGPVTNNIGNEAKIDIDYADMDQMIANAGHYTRRRPGRLMSMQTVAFFCVALPRGLYEAIGGLDEAFGQGFFEDDDYCRRAQAAGWKVACAEDVFIHHHLSASFNKVNPEARQALFERNKAIYELKWGAWQPHVYRDVESGAEAH